MKFHTALRRKTQIHTCTEKSLNQTIEKMLKNNTYAMIKFNTLKNPEDIYIFCMQAMYRKVLETDKYVLLLGRGWDWSCIQRGLYL